MKLCFRYRLRTLLLAIAILALPLRWWGVHAAADRRFHNLIASIEEQGGQVGFGPSEAEPSFGEKVWLALGGDDRLGRPAVVLFPNSKKPTDAEFAALHVTELPALESLDLDGTKISDASLAEFEQFAGLKELSVASTRITDAGLAKISRLSRLEVLDLTGTAVTDAGVAKLAALKRLEVLNVRDTSVTRECIRRLHDALPATLINHNAKPGSRGKPG